MRYHLPKPGFGAGAVGLRMFKVNPTTPSGTAIAMMRSSDDFCVNGETKRRALRSKYGL